MFMHLLTSFWLHLREMDCNVQIHVMFIELKKIFVAIVKCFIKNDEINGKSAKALLNLDVKFSDIHLLLEKIEIAAKTGRLLKVLSPYNHKKEKERMLQFYVATVKQPQRRLPLEDVLPFKFNLLAFRCKGTGK